MRYITLCLLPFYCFAEITAPTQAEHVSAAHSAKVEAAMKLFDAGNVEPAQALADEVIHYFENAMEPNTDYVCVNDLMEFHSYVDSKKGVKKKMVRLDNAYGDALHLRSFIAAHKGQWDLAMVTLTKERNLRPFSAEALLERGYVWNRLKKPTEALQDYKDALELAERQTALRGPSSVPTNSPVAKALRGLGYTLIELKDLDGAQKALERSLVIDPGNKNALNDLGYIQKLRRAKK